MRRIYLLWLCAMVFLARPCDAQNAAARLRGIDSIANLPRYAHRDMPFETVEHQMGRVGEQEAPQSAVFRFVNSGATPLVVTRVATSCGCTVATFDARPVLSGQGGQITATYNPQGHPGEVIQHLFVYTNLSTSRPTARLTLLGYVEPDAEPWAGYRVLMGPSLRAKGRRVAFLQLSRSESRTERVECVNTGSVPLRLSAVADLTPSHISFRTEPEVIAPGAVADLVITVRGEALEERFAAVREWELLLDGLPGKPSEKTVKIITDFIN